MEKNAEAIKYRHNFTLLYSYMRQSIAIFWWHSTTGSPNPQTFSALPQTLFSYLFRNFFRCSGIVMVLFMSIVFRRNNNGSHLEEVCVCCFVVVFFCFWHCGILLSFHRFERGISGVSVCITWVWATLFDFWEEYGFDLCHGNMNYGLLFHPQGSVSCFRLQIKKNGWERNDICCCRTWHF